MKNIIIGILLVAIVALSYMAFSGPRNNITSEKSSSQLIASYDRPDSVLFGINLPITQSATCSFDRVNIVSFGYRIRIMNQA